MLSGDNGTEENLSNFQIKSDLVYDRLYFFKLLSPLIVVYCQGLIAVS
jgi:hypothetical protein